MKLNLKNITLFVLHFYDKPYPTFGLEECLKYADFGEVLILTNNESFSHVNIKCKHISPIKTMEEYSLFFIRDLWRYFDTDYCMTAHPDGFIINPESWTNEFLNYDYIGAPWKFNGGRFRDNLNQPGIGNGGFSLRSKNICKYVSENYFIISDNEDKYYSNVIECHKPNYIKYPPVKLALQFSQESLFDQNIRPFGFHNFKTPGCEGGIYWYNEWKNRQL
jgi:hypothetical protein